MLLEADVLGANRILRIRWDEAWHILERAYERGRAVKGKKIVGRIGVDEKAAAKGHQYLTLVSDLDRGTIEFVADDRKTSSLVRIRRASRAWPAPRGCCRRRLA